MSDDCLICCCPLGSQAIGACVPCGHVVHVECFEEWAQHKKRSQRHVKCPMCSGSSKQFVRIFLDLSAAQETIDDDDAISLDEDEENERLLKQEMKQKRQEERNSETDEIDDEEGNGSQDVSEEDTRRVEYRLDQEDSLDEENNNPQEIRVDVPVAHAAEVIVLDDDEEDRVFPVAGIRNDIIYLDDDEGNSGQNVSKQSHQSSHATTHKVKKYKRLALTYRKRFETIEAQREEKAQKYQELQNEIVKLHKQIEDSVSSREKVESTVHRKDRELEGLRLEYQRCLREKGEAQSALANSQAQLRTMEEHLRLHKSELVSKYEKACATSLKEFEYIIKKEHPRLKQENQELKQQLRQLQDQKNKRPVEAESHEENSNKKTKNGKKHLMQQLGHMSFLVERDTPRLASARQVGAPTPFVFNQKSRVSDQQHDYEKEASSAGPENANNTLSSSQENSLKMTKKMSAQAVRMGLAARRTSAGSQPPMSSRNPDFGRTTSVTETARLHNPYAPRTRARQG